MTQTNFFADTLTLTVSSSGGSAIAVGIIEGVDIVAEFENVELFGSETIKREDVARTKLRVPLTFKTYKFHPELYAYAMGQQNVAKGVEGESSANESQGVINDSNTVPLFEIRGTITGKNGEAFKCKVTEAYFEAIPLPIPAGEFVGPEFSMIGKDLVVSFITT